MKKLGLAWQAPAALAYVQIHLLPSKIAINK
jgi:hypothetical protein